MTDYTQNPGFNTVEADWCPPQLATRVLKIELWNEAAQMGPQMKAGEFYTMKNVRVKTSSGGQMEGSFSEVHKLRKMDEDMLEGEPHFEALLR